MRFKTESGSEYIVDGGMVQRVNMRHEKRADGEWVRLINDPVIEVGSRVILVTESLRRFGPDDYGTEPGEENTYSMRVTSEVVEVSH